MIHDHSSKKNQSIGYNIQFSLDWFLILIQATLTFEEKRSLRPSNLANRITLAGDSLGNSWHKTYLYCYSDSLCESRTNRVRASQWLEWSVWINFENFQKPRMWEYINQYVSYDTLYHSGAKKKQPIKELFELFSSCSSRITYIR